MIFIILFIGFCVGAFVSLLTCAYLLKKRIHETDIYWRKICLRSYDEWIRFHYAELSRWQVYTEYLIKKAAYEAADAEYNKWTGKKNDIKKQDN